MNTVYGVYESYTKARAAAVQLMRQGVDRGDMHVLAIPSEQGGDNAPENARLRRTGSFADVDPEVHNVQRERKGSFGDVAPEEHNTQLEQHGSFGDVAPENEDVGDKERVGNFDDMNMKHSSPETVVSDLEAAGLSTEEARQCAAQISGGGAVLLVKGDVGDLPRLKEMIRSA